MNKKENITVHCSSLNVHRSSEQVETMDTEKTNTLTLFLLEGADAYHQWVFEKIRPFLGKDILEVGCGIGNLTELLLSQGRVIAVDVNEGYLQTVENKFRCHLNLKGVLLWDIRQTPSKDLGIPIDTIVCSNVLEHIEDDDDVLKSLYHLLPAGGKLIILVPALKALYNVFDKELGHFRRYSRSELFQKLTRNGFRICSLKYFNFFGILGWFVNGTLLRRRLLPEKQIGIFNKMVPLFIWVEKIIPTPVGQSLIVVGEKG
jgi:2-polyprenyl-3-methyl-5-hydroxy-6-metoxy-1,4-benzoquinol methylase